MKQVKEPIKVQFRGLLALSMYVWEKVQKFLIFLQKSFKNNRKYNYYFAKML